MNQGEQRKTLSFIEDLSNKVGQYLLDRQKKIHILNHKDRVDICTDIDLGAEKLIIDTIQEKFPNHSILSEEMGLIDKKSDYCWIIDPLDGTKEYIRNIPLFSTVMGLEYKKEMVVSIVSHPSNNFDTFSAGKGLDAFRNHQKITVSNVDSIDKSYLYYHSPNYTVEEKYAFPFWKTITKLSRSFYRIRGMAYENLVMGWLASGGAEAYIHFGGKCQKGPEWYDIAPGLLIVFEAAGKYSNLKGNSVKHDSLIEGIVATNGKIHDDLIRMLNK